MSDHCCVLRNKRKDVKCLEFPIFVLKKQPVSQSSAVIRWELYTMNKSCSKNKLLAACLWVTVFMSGWCFTGRVVFHMSDWLHHCLAAGRILFKNTFEAYMDQYMQSKLEQILQEHHMVSLITQLRGKSVRPSSYRPNVHTVWKKVRFLP